MSLQNHLEAGTTSLAYCWVIERNDGVVVGVTDHDEDVTVDGTLCSSAVGMVTTKFEQTLGLLEDNLDIEGVIDDEQFVASEMRAGKFDDAEVRLYLVNWADPSEYIHMATGTFGQIIEGDGDTFIVEFLSRSYELSQPVGRTYQRTCDTKLGSAKCGIDLSLPAYRTTTTVQTVSDTTITVASLSGYEDDWFTLGSVEVNGETIGIRQHEGVTLSLWREPDTVVNPTDAITVIAGCKQDSETCRTKFDNILNFRGFHLMPGNDRLTEYPIRGQDEYEGESLFL